MARSGRGLRNTNKIAAWRSLGDGYGSTWDPWLDAYLEEISQSSLDAVGTGAAPDPARKNLLEELKAATKPSQMASPKRQASPTGHKGTPKSGNKASGKTNQKVGGR